MKIYKKLKPFISLVCAVLLFFSLIIFTVVAVSTNSVTATTSATVMQGNTAYCYVNIDSTEGLAALDVTVHFDPAKVKILNVYNSINCTLYDSVTNTDNIQFSYILDGKGSASKTRLFYFQYQVLSNADIGASHFDITIGEAYDNSLNTVEVSGSRCNFTITEKVTKKTCSVSSTSSISSSIKKEFTLDYQLSTYQIASGTAVISYDPELFEVVNVTNGEFLNGKIADVNTDLHGEIYISFIGTEYNTTKRNFASVTFRTIKNVTETSEITFKAAELIDKELNSISCNPYTTNVNLTFDKTYTGDAPAMKLDGTFSYDDMKVTLVVSLEKDSRLGAGDFVIKFDPELVAYNSSTKGFSPTFFNINDKNVENGELKFHIISLSDIVTEETVLTVVFDVKHPYNCETADFTLNGTGLTDSLTETVVLNFIDDSVWLEYQIKFLNYDGTLLQSGMYRYGDTVYEPDAPTKESDAYGVYTFSGWDKEVTPCTAETVYTATYDIEYTDYTAIFKNSDGTEISRTTYHYGDAVVAPDNSTKEGYTITGWTPAIPETMPDTDMTFTADLEPIIYTATFVADGKTVDIIEFNVENQTIVAPSVPEKIGYTAVWEEYEVNLADFTVNAVYTPIMYTATFVADGTTVDIIEFNVENQTIVAPSVPEKIGYTAVWEEYEVNLADFTVNAVYTPIIYTATFVADGTTVDIIEFNVENQTIVAPSVPEKIGYTAVWEEYEVNLADFTVNAVYTPIIYTATFTHNGETIGTDAFTVEDASLDYPYIAKWAYYDWVWDKHRIEAENLTIEGRYVPITYTITFVSSGKVIKTQEYNVNTVDSIVAPAKSLPAKQHYTTAWEDWSGKIGNITVNEIYVPIKYKISFYCQNSLVATRSYTIETSVSQIALPTPTKIDGYDAEWPKFKLEYKDQVVHAVYTPIVYTATFIADGVVISTQTFTVETEGLDEPPVPQKAGYYARWSNYIIEAKDITIVAKYHSPEVVVVSKRTLNVGDAFRILASCNFETTEKTWASSNTSVATVNQHGRVTAVGKGECEIKTTCYGKDSLGNDIQASKTTIIIVNGNSESDNSKRSFRGLFDEFFEVTLHDLLYNLREFMIVLFRYAY